MDHNKHENHIMDWDMANVIRMGNNRHQRLVKEAVEIRKRAHTAMNWDK